MTSQYNRWRGIMKAVPFEEKRLAKWEPPYIVQPKYDGVRCRAIPLETGNCLLLSSEENVIFSVPHITTALNKASFSDELDGELYCHGMSFEEIVSITSRTVNLHPDYRAIRFHIFDIVNEEPQGTRAIKMVQAVDKLRSNVFEAAPFWLCYSLDAIMKAYDKIIGLGYEGIIVRNVHAPYVRKRSTWVMKFKPKKEDIYEIIGYQEEVSKEGIPKQVLGSLLLRSQEGDTFSVGTGLTDNDRSRLWGDRESLGGKSVKVQYQHLTSGKKVPRFPVFMEVVE